MDVLDGSLVDGITVTYPLPWGEKSDSRWLFISALSMLLGAALWRMNYSLIMYNPGNGYQYFPSAEELLISIGFVSIEVCAYILIIRLFLYYRYLKKNIPKTQKKLLPKKRHSAKKLAEQNNVRKNVSQLTQLPVLRVIYVLIAKLKTASSPMLGHPVPCGAVWKIS